MAVIAMWMCDRDNSMHESKKDADAHDKMLELAEQFTMLMEEHLNGVDEKQAEEFGLLLAQHKDKIVQACKGKPEALNDLAGEEDNTVTPIKAAKK
ncbi:MAG: YebG family protein [Candidatus Sedimenticola sp. PURPLELP]